MTDFFDDLERRLVEAAADRPRRLRRARARRGALVGAVLVALLAGGAGLATALSGSATGDDPGTPVAPRPTTARTVTVSPDTGAITPGTGNVTVAILNATAVPGLARGVANRLQNARFKIGNVTNADAQDRRTTAVHYAPGRSIEAGDVAAAIGLPDFVLRPITARERTIAGAHASVVVLVGADQNTAPHRGTSRTP